MHNIELTEELRQQIGQEVFRQTFEQYVHPTGYNFVPDAVEKISTIAYLFFCELGASRGNDGSYRKRISKPLVLKEVEKTILTNVFKNSFNIKIEWTTPHWIIRVLDCAIGKQAARLLPKNLVGLENAPVTKYYARASWAADNPHIKPFERPPLPSLEALQQLFVQEQLHSALKPDVAINSGERAILGHGFLLGAHSQLFANAVQPTTLTQIDIGDVPLETMQLILQTIYTKSLPFSEKTAIEPIIEFTKDAHRLGFISSVKLIEPLLCQKADTDYDAVVEIATELKLSTVLEYCEKLKVVKKLPVLPFGTDELMIE